MTRSQMFSRASRQSQVLTGSFDWLNGWPLSFVISQSDHLLLVLIMLHKIQLFRQMLSHTSVKANATMPIGMKSIMGSNNLAFLD